MRLPCGHHGEDKGPIGFGPCSDPDCAGTSPDPWTLAQEDGEGAMARLRETRDYRQAKFRK